MRAATVDPSEHDEPELGPVRRGPGPRSLSRVEAAARSGARLSQRAVRLLGVEPVRGCRERPPRHCDLQFGPRNGARTDGASVRREPHDDLPRPAGSHHAQTAVPRSFTPRRITGLDIRIREICADLLDPHIGGNGFDFVQDFGARMPSRVISSLVGVPSSRAGANPSARRRNVPHRARGGHGQRHSVAASLELAGYLMQLVDERRARSVRRPDQRPGPS